jgi:toxin HigB-1
VNIRFAERRLERLATDRNYDAGYDRDIVRGFRRLIQFIRDARDERDLYLWKSLHFEKLKGKRSHERSLRLNRQFRLIVQIEPAAGGNIIVVQTIEDYH